MSIRLCTLDHQTPKKSDQSGEFVAAGDMIDAVHRLGRGVTLFQQGSIRGAIRAIEETDSIGALFEETMV